jgi:hypothetical protein
MGGELGSKEAGTGLGSGGVARFTGEDVQPSAQARAFLKEAAASAKIDFLPQEIRFRNSRMPLVPSKLFNRRQGTAPNQPGRKTPPLEGWGIND